MQIEDVLVEGLLVPQKMANILCSNVEELSLTLDFNKEDLQDTDFFQMDVIQNRLRLFMAILTKISGRFDSLLTAYAWYRSTPLAGFDGETAMHLIQKEKSDELLDYLDAVDVGIYT